LSVDPNNGKQQKFTFLRPPDAPDLSVDVNYALRLRQLALEKQKLEQEQLQHEERLKFERERIEHERLEREQRDSGRKKK
jgi:hypothetical protein